MSSKPSNTVTMSDVAKLAGVSRASASKYFNGDMSLKQATIARIQAACEALQYVPNQHAVNLVKGQSSLIAAVVPSTTDSFYSGTLKYIEDFANEKGLNLIVQSTHGDPERERKIIQSLRSLKPRSLILVPTSNDETSVQFFEALRHDIHIVWLDNCLLENASYVVNDNRHSLEIITDYFLEKDIHPYYLDVPKILEKPSITARRKSYQDCLKRANLKPRFIVDETSDITWPDANYGYEMIHQWLKETNWKAQPCGIICMNDNIAVGALSALNNAGVKIGKQVLLAGHDDIELAPYLHPPLTTVKQSCNQMARAVVDAVLEPEIIREVTIHSRLVKRLSA
ncbi:LacI family DNA-binding transcriptional regulator [Vibrio penaeicida]|uniref:LacI family transcriptional regulator n=1 Tax=Vibrio penaeicida TaxID=104609 RepID=A0AAV5NQI1_9VIBR|nr:LacI family DNA-binding transcriptional regulator [Vibrio penaeicida]RTZ23922.1 LacI family transcriptional regulator [Vibrio penaeicida]GLQ72870.1 LacI family transcriptional regulator [Vibrio penaeicida]